MSKIYSVTTYQTMVGTIYVEANSYAEAALLIDNGHGDYEEDMRQYEPVEYELENIIDDDSCEHGFEFDEFKAFEKAYNDGRDFYANQSQLDLGDAANGQARDAHEFALRYAREETGLGVE